MIRCCLVNCCLSLWLVEKCLMELDIGDGQFIYYFSREKWGAAPWDTARVKPLSFPIARVRFTYTGYQYCRDQRECMRCMRDLQSYHQNEKGLPDLPYNFIVCGDGSVYEGGGWTLNTELPSGHSWQRGKTLSIAFMGDFAESDPPYSLLYLAMDFLKYGLKEKKIQPLFKLSQRHDSPHIEIIHKDEEIEGNEMLN